MLKTERIVEMMRQAADVEHVGSLCFGYLATLLKNGTVKEIFQTFSANSEANKELLLSRLKDLGIDDFQLKHTCKYCQLSAESFSLLGAVNLGLEISEVAIKAYKALEQGCDTQNDAELFKSLLKEKLEQKHLLQKERQFDHHDEDVFMLIDTHCISEVISKLWV
jgi:ferritin-like protein